ncbi:putative SP-containing protein [Vairimorpha necatrix]|uniref:SP-containing protein n=1 Tax=Vairimorpha necatrix TaxID=6039 RepID=A0AAX4JAC8_9MICR
MFLLLSTSLIACSVISRNLRNALSNGELIFRMYSKNHSFDNVAEVRFVRKLNVNNKSNNLSIPLSTRQVVGTDPHKIYYEDFLFNFQATTIKSPRIHEIAYSPFYQLNINNESLELQLKKPENQYKLFCEKVLIPKLFYNPSDAFVFKIFYLKNLIYDLQDTRSPFHKAVTGILKDLQYFVDINDIKIFIEEILIKKSFLFSKMVQNSEDETASKFLIGLITDFYNLKNLYKEVKINGNAKDFIITKFKLDENLIKDKKSDKQFSINDKLFKFVVENDKNQNILIPFEVKQKDEKILFEFDHQMLREKNIESLELEFIENETDEIISKNINVPIDIETDESEYIYLHMIEE